MVRMHRAGALRATEQWRGPDPSLFGSLLGIHKGFL